MSDIEDDLLEYVPKKARRLEGTTSNGVGKAGTGIGLLSSTRSTAGFKKPSAVAGIPLLTSSTHLTSTGEGNSIPTGPSSSLHTSSGGGVGGVSLNIDEAYAKRNELPDDTDEVADLLRVGRLNGGGGGSSSVSEDRAIYHTVNIVGISGGSDDVRNRLVEEGEHALLERLVAKEHEDWLTRSAKRRDHLRERPLVWER